MAPKPGWTGMGERLDPCFSCKTKGKLPGVPCKVCLSTGKVDPEKPRTVSGVEVIKGFHVCGTCHGTGFDFYIPCNQCKRSPAPGWTCMGERMELCNRCQGEGKLPGTVCKECNGKCIVRDK